MITLILLLATAFFTAAALFWQSPFGPLLSLSLFLLFALNVHLVLGLLFQTLPSRQLKKLSLIFGMSAVVFSVGAIADYFSITKIVSPNVITGALALLLSGFFLLLSNLFLIVYSHRMGGGLRLLLKFMFIATAVGLAYLPYLFLANGTLPW